MKPFHRADSQRASPFACRSCQTIARSGIAGRAVGNLRQPNHLASLLLWSAVAVVPLVELGTLARRAAAVVLFALMVLGITPRWLAIVAPIPASA